MVYSSATAEILLLPLVTNLLRWALTSVYSPFTLSLWHSAAHFVSNSRVLFSKAGPIISLEAVVWNQQLWTNIKNWNTFV